MANLLFKRGLHANLPTTAVDGAFYLTEDTHRLYAGIGTKLVDLNKYIQVVNTIDGDSDSLAALTNVKDGDFAYVKTPNLLAVYQNGGWIQINKNTDTTSKSLDITGSGTADNATVTFTLKDSANNTVSDAITFVGTQGTDVSVDANGNITIKGCTYTIGGEANGNNYDITLSASDDEVTAATTGKVTLMAGDNIKLTAKTGGVEISATDTNTKNASVDVNIAGENITVSVKDTDNQTKTDTQNNALYMTYGSVTGDNALRASNQGHMDVYSIDEIDAKFRGLNGLTYKTTVSTLKELTDLTNVASGDMYMASASITDLTSADLANFVGVPSGTTAFEKGDLFIATGTEGANGFITSPKWTYVPAGDDLDKDTTYTATLTAASNKFEIKSSANATLLSNTITNGSPNTLDITSTADGKALTTTIKHKTVTVAEETASKTTGGNSVTGIVDLEVDEAGHLSKIITKTTELATYTLSGATVSASGNIATVVDTLKDSDNTARGTSTFKVDASNSDNLKVTASSNSVVMKLEWDTFN